MSGLRPGNRFVDGGDHLNAIDSTHAYIHKGHTYCFGNLKDGVADGDSLDLLVVTGATYDFHLAIDAAAGGDAHLHIYEGATVSNAGSALTEFNKVRGIGDTGAPITATADPTVTGTGTQLGPTRFFPGGSGGQAAGISGSVRSEWILKPSTTYLIRITNQAGNAKSLALYCEGYEHSPITAKDQV